ncbi:MAG: NAD(P)-dependent oxidoreductase [Proteobacteria bacterium]|nr:NAD(P)-dependent oxidoreductase [Pseudomonadota bacterium]
MADYKKIGFIGTGVMGGRMCRNLATKIGVPVIAFDMDMDKVAALDNVGVEAAPSVAAVIEAADIVLMCLPGEPQVRAICLQEGGILEHVRKGQVIVDMTTATADIERELAPLFAEKGADFVDAPVAKGVSSAEDGTLSIMFGGPQAVFDRVKPVLDTMGTEVTRCGEVGTGQVVKLMNNMVLVMNVQALAEAMAIGKRSGVDPEVLFTTLSRGSADSFALRKHGMQYMMKEQYPDDVFPVTYSIKDMSYTLRLIDETGVNAEAARLVDRKLKEVDARGWGKYYSPVLYRLLED